MYTSLLSFNDCNPAPDKRKRYYGGSMKLRRILALLLMVACVATILGACHEDTPDNTEPPAKEYLRIAENKETTYKIVNYLTNSKPVEDFASNLSRRVGATLAVVSEAEAGSTAIYIGTAEQLAGKGGVRSAIPYTGYEIKIDNGNVYLALATEDIAEEAMDALRALIVKIETNVYGLDVATVGMKNVNGITEFVPEFETEKGKLVELHDSGNNNYQALYSDLGKDGAADLAAYETKLVAEGYKLYSENTIENNRFATYHKGDTMIYCSYFFLRQQVRVVYGPKTYMGADAPVTSYEKVVTPSVSIIGMSDSVLCMVIQLADGSFVVIDGGWNTDKYCSVTLNSGTAQEYSYSYQRDAEKDMENLYNFLKDNTPGGGKPQVTWMITHADPDHITLPTRFFKDYKDKFSLNTIVYNFPNMTNIGLGESAGSTNNPSTFTAYVEGFINNANKNFPDVKHFVYHTGQKMYLPGCEIEFLFTASEDYRPNVMPWCNHTSGAWRFTIEGKTVLITGDTENGLNNLMASSFGDYLKSDVLQVVHHGSNGATIAFYQKVQPEVCFWPCREESFKYDLRHLGEKSGWGFNKYLRETATQHYHGSTTTTLLLPSLEVKK